MPRVRQRATTPPVTLMQAHEALARERPSKYAPPAAWVAYYRRSAAVYAEIAEVDRGHHHEALYWSGRERQKASKIAEQPSGRRETED